MRLKGGGEEKQEKKYPSVSNRTRTTAKHFMIHHLILFVPGQAWIYLARAKMALGGRREAYRALQEAMTSGGLWKLLPSAFEVAWSGKMKKSWITE